MKHLIKIISLISALCLVLGMLSGCSGTGTEKAEVYSKVVDTFATLENEPNGVVAENDYFKMVWNKSSEQDGMSYDRAAIEFVSKKDGSVWATTPKQYYDTTDPVNLFGNGLINSSLVIEARNEAEQTFEYNAYDYCIMNGRFSSKKMANGKGIRVTYYFDQICAVLSVDYYLEDDGFKVSVDPKNIICYANDDGFVSNIESVTPAPFVCGAKNTKAGNKNSYVVLPSGSGTLMYIDQRTDASVRTFEGLVYGEDPTVDKWDDSKNETPVSMPFYGIKNGKNALCAIIEQGAESCAINSRVGDNTLGADLFAEGDMVGYSYVNATYNVLGYNTVYASGTWRYQYSNQVEKNINPLVIGYYPLSGSSANYTGVAKRYQQYLVEKENMTKSQDNSLLTVKLFGSYVEDDLFVGIPTKKEVSLTTYSEATEILGELKKISGGSLVADMYGFGEGGINNTELAGGYKLTGVSGSKSDLKEFVEYTNQNGIKTFFNFDTIKFYESGNGYSTNSDVATNVNGIPAPVYQYWYSTRERYTRAQGGKVGAMIARDQLDDATNDAVALADKFGITGLAFDTLGSVCYSDYSEPKDGEYAHQYPWRNNMGNDVKAITVDVKKNNKTILMDGAYPYAAVGADIITNIPTVSNQDDGFDLDVPLYQIVFQGYRANSVGSINTATNKRTQFLKAIETGSGLSFDLMANYYQELRKQNMRGLHAALYEDNKNLIEEYVNESKNYLTSVAGATITNHTYVTKDVTKTVFDNGVTVFVNYGDTDYKVGKTLVKAQNFLAK